MAWTMIFLNVLILYMCLLLGPAAAVNGELTIEVIHENYLPVGMLFFFLVRP